MVNGLFVKVLNINRRQISRFELADVQLDPVAETGHRADGERYRPTQPLPDVAPR